MRLVKFSLITLFSFNILNYTNLVYAQDIKPYIDNNIDINAYNFYKKGLEAYSLHTSEDYNESIKFFDKALSINPNFSQALSSKSLSQSFLAYRLRQNEEQYNNLFELAKINAEKAILINPNLSDGYIALSAYYKFNYNESKALEQANKALSLSPNNPDVYFWLWYSSSIQNPDDYNIKQAILLNPKMLIAYSELGNAYFKYSRYDDALLQYQKALSINPKYVYAYNNIASVYGQNNDYNTALEYFKKALDSNIFSLEVINNLYYIYNNQKNKEIIYIDKNYIINVLKNAIIYNPNSLSMIEYLDKLLSIEKTEYTISIYQDIFDKTKNPKVYKKIGDIYLEKNNYKDALVLYKKILENNNSDFEINNNICFIYYYLEDYSNFLKSLKKIDNDYQVINDIENYNQALKKYETHIRIGDYFYNNTDTKFNNTFSLVAYKKALSLNDKDPEIYIKIANSIDSYYNFRGENDNELKFIFTESPLKFIEKAYNLDPNNKKYIILLAEKYLYSKEYDKAINLYNKILNIEPNNIDVLSFMVNIYQSKNEQDEEIKYLNKIIEIDNNNFLANNRLADYYYYNQDYNKALIYYKNLINTNNAHKQIYRTIATIYEKLGKLDEAKEYLFQEKIFELKYYNKQKSAESYYNLSNAYRLEGRIEDAVRELKEALKVDPSYTQASFSLASLYNEKSKKINNDSYILPFKKKYENNPKNISNLINLANSYMKISDLDNAEKIYNEFLKTSPNPEIYNNLSKIYKIKSDLQIKESIRMDKLKEYKNILQFYSYNHKQFYDLAINLKNQGKINDSIAGLEEAIRINPYNSEYYLQLAKLYKEINNEQNYQKELKSSCNLGSIEACNILNKK